MLLFYCFINTSFGINSNNAEKKGKYIIYVNYKKDIAANRFFVVRLSDRKIIIVSKCSHAFKTGLQYATAFSNEVNSKKTSLGKYRIAEKYDGVWGKSFRLDGLEEMNSNARLRAIVIHPDSKMKTRWSWGCFAIPPETIEALYKLDIYNSTLIAFH